MRPSDLGAPATFTRSDSVKFGERVERPPDLRGMIKTPSKKHVSSIVSSGMNNGRKNKSSNSREIGVRVKSDSIVGVKRGFSDGIIHNGVGCEQSSTAEMEVCF